MVNSVVETKFCPCSGEGYAILAFQNSSLEWTSLNVEEGLYEISTRYATESMDRPCDLFIDGAQAAKFSFTGTPTWRNWNLETELVDLVSGNHTLMIRPLKNPGPNIDWIAIRRIAESASPTMSSIPSTFPTLEPSFTPSAMPSDVPGQLVVAMTMSGDGNTLALLVGDSNDGLRHQVHTYLFDGITWVELDRPLRLSLCSLERSPRETMRLSYYGDVLLLTDGDTVTVFDWEAAANMWYQRGDELQKAVNGYYPDDGWHNSSLCRTEAIALSTDGRVVALNLGGNETNSIVTLSWNWATLSKIATSWEQRETTPLPGSREGPLSIAINGRELAIALPLVSADLSGGIQTYEYPRHPCDPGFFGFRVTFTIKPALTRFRIMILTADGGVFDLARGPYFFPAFPGAETTPESQHKLATVVEEICIPDPLCLNLTVYPTDFGGFNVVQEGAVILEIPTSDEPQIFMLGNTSVCNFSDFY